jgi:hypothetical protein
VGTTAFGEPALTAPRVFADTRAPLDELAVSRVDYLACIFNVLLFLAALSRPGARLTVEWRRRTNKPLLVSTWKRRVAAQPGEVLDEAELARLRGVSAGNRA